MPAQTESPRGRAAYPVGMGSGPRGRVTKPGEAADFVTAQPCCSEIYVSSGGEQHRLAQRTAEQGPCFHRDQMPCTEPHSGAWKAMEGSPILALL